MIDTHCHLDFPQLLDDLPAVLRRAREVGVTRYVIPGTVVADAAAALELARGNADIYAAVGIHPCHAHEHTDSDVATMRALLGSGELVAIGEVGLDYFHDEAPPARQAVVFSQMIGLAREFALPLIIHTRESFANAHAQLRAEGAGIPTVIHCFTGSLEQARAWLDLGCHISFTGILTYKRNSELREIAAYVPLEKVLLETDAPFLAPEGFRGQLCEPRFVRNVGECLSAVRGISLEEVDRVTTANAEQFFKFQ